MAKDPKPIGRPSDYSQELAELICERVANGEGLVKICKSDDMPARSTVMRWLIKNKDFQDIYAQARDYQADFYFEEILEIADGSEGDSYVDDKGNTRVDHENINRSRLRVDARKWIVARLAPRKYGDQVQFDTENNNWTVNGIPVKTK